MAKVSLTLMNTFQPGDIVCFKDRFSPEMMVIEESDGKVKTFWQDAIGVVMIEDLPAASLEPLALEGSHLSASIQRVAELLKREDEGIGRGGRGKVKTLRFSKYLPV